MKIRSKSEPHSVDMTPMIDIVFQLIAFFMVITNFEQTQADERIKLPRDQLARPPEVKRDDRLTLNIGYERSREGMPLHEQPYVFFGDDQVLVPDMGERLDFERQFFESIGTRPSEVTVEIRADAEVPTGLVQLLIKLCQEAEFERFSLRATQETR